MWFDTRVLGDQSVDIRTKFFIRTTINHIGISYMKNALVTRASTGSGKDSAGILVKNSLRVFSIVRKQEDANRVFRRMLKQRGGG